MVGLPRRRLTQRLDRTRTSRVAMVVAPAGFGKTTAMAQWARRGSADIAWYRVDPADGRGDFMVENLAAAIHVGTGVAVAATDVRSLVSVAETWERPLVLVVDDLHLGGPVAERILYDLLLAAPPQLHLLIGSRRLPAYNLARSELSGFVVTGEELCFRSEEVEELFAEVYQQPLTMEEATLLTQRTGGWAAALQIFHLSLPDATAAGRRRAVQALLGSPRYARDYLCWEILDGLPEELVDFVGRTCVLEVLTADRCDALLGRHGSQRLLEDLQRWQALTTSKDGGLTFRYHEILRSHLESELAAELSHAELTAWYGRAAEVLESRGAIAEAVRAHARAEAWEEVRRLARGNGHEVAGAARAAWVGSIPAWVAKDEPGLAVLEALVAVDDGRLEEGLESAGRAVACEEGGDAVQAAARLRDLLLPWAGTGSAATVVSSESWASLLREALRQGPSEVAAKAAALAEPWASFTRGVSLLLSGDGIRGLQVLRDVSSVANQDPRLALAARLAACVAAGDGGAEARRVAVGATDEELPWLARLAQALCAAQQSVAFPGMVQGSGEQARCEERGDRWGAALCMAMECAAAFVAGRPDVAALERLAGRLRLLGAPVLEAWARAASAYATATMQLPDAGREAASAEAFARAARVPGALAIAYAALGLSDPSRTEELLALADSSASEAGMAFRPWRSAPAVRANPETAPEGSAEVAPDAASDEHVTSSAGRRNEMALRCFGRFDIRIDGHPPDLSRVRPRARALLRLLAVEAGRPVHRELIIDALWRDLDREAGTHNLHVSVSSLRRALEPGVPRGASRLLARDGERYVLQLPPGSTCDLRLFDRAAADAYLARAAGRIDDAIGSLSHALDLYSGEVLPEDGPEEWVLGHREHYRARAAEAAASLSELHLSRHDPGAAAAAALQSIDIDPCRDASWRLLLSSYQASGDLAAAERARRSYADVLASLGVVTDTASAVLPRQGR